MRTKTKTIPNIDIEDYIKNKKILIEGHLKDLFSNSYFKEPKELWDAVKYSLLDSGKKIRGTFCITSCESLISSCPMDCLTIASSIEIIHSMSLIHDDLPSMDNDDLRRNKPSCHKAFGESTAILAGDAMLTLAFYLIAEYTKEISDPQKLEIINTLTKSFHFGLVPGQILDLSSNKKYFSLDDLEKISKLKTAELIRSSVVCGAIVALNQNPNKNKIISKLSDFGLNIGIAFQIIDDILDVTSDTKTLGKTSGKDKKQNKQTFPSILGIEEAKKMANNLIKKAKSQLTDIPINTEYLFSLADYIISRAY